MPQIRQDPESALVVRSLALRLPSGHRIEAHHHAWPQLVYATEGVMSVVTESGSWVVPPQRAVWIPAGFEHSISTTGAVRMRTVYLAPGHDRRLPAGCCVVYVTPLLRELIVEITRLGALSSADPEQARLARVLVDRIRGTRVAPLELKLPRDSRARTVAERVQADLSRPHRLPDLARGSGASVRTIERLFVQETELTFGRWLQRTRALHALERLAAGDSVTSAGLAVGYESTSAFIAMFKRVLGVTPGAYFVNESSADARRSPRS